ncbi:PH domain-containing protein [Lachnospiraceae bacterium ASD3451]|uniref:PH domain-containing protein n=1 Tax=Diplocloster agilis TaxID=2850323 RepID=UPI001D7DB3DD|nr:PH domain-containing protein [Diplocloster agilis]
MINLIFLPNLIRNRVEIRDDKLYLYFGFFKDSMEIASIKEVRKTHNPISSSAASLDRLLIL